MGRKTLALLFAAFLGTTAFAGHITFMPQWTPQAQFAGYYVALEKGYYSEAGVDVTLRHPSSSSKLSCMDYLAGGDVDIVTSMLATGISHRADGDKIINVLQTSQNTGLCCMAHTPISKLEDLNGMSIGRWKSGFGENATIAQKDLGLDIEWIPYLYGTSLFISKAVDATLCYSFNELIQLYLSMGETPKENILFFKDCGYNYPEDGLYVTETFYNAHKEDVENFVEASKRGWDFCREHPEEALKVVKKFTNLHHIRTNDTHQRMMLKVILTLQENRKTGKADYAPVSRELFDELSRKGAENGLFSRVVKYEEIIRTK